MSVLNEIDAGLYQWSEFSIEKQINFNGYYLINNGESVIIDPAILQDEKTLDLKLLIKNNSNNPLKAILLTNVHHDRMSLKIKEIFGTPIYIHENDAESLDFKADNTFSNNDKLFCGLKVIHLKNQKSPGESAFYLTEQKKMFIGDALIGKVPGKLSLLPSEKFSDINEAKKSLHILKNFDFVDLLLGDGSFILGNGKEALEELLCD